MSQQSLVACMATVGARIDREMLELLPSLDDPSQPLAKAMLYPISSGGKRFRPFLVYAVGEVLGAEPKACIRVGAAIELLHTYSLVHDDLPAMDDAAMRRGRAACHREFDEATAILVGDALLALAFDSICRDDWPATANQRLVLTQKLAYAAGGERLCAGQMLDLAAAKQILSIEEISRLQALKTGALIRYCGDAACILSNATSEDFGALGSYTDALGLAFQISDDLLDVIGNSREVGKDLGRDKKQSKATFVTHLGIEGAQAELDRLRQSSRQQLTRFGDKADSLRDLFDFVVCRRS